MGRQLVIVRRYLCLRLQRAPQPKTVVSCRVLKVKRTSETRVLSCSEKATRGLVALQSWATAGRNRIGASNQGATTFQSSFLDHGLRELNFARR